MYEDIIAKHLTESTVTGTAGVPGEDKVIAQSQNGITGEERMVLRRLKKGRKKNNFFTKAELLKYAADFDDRDDDEEKRYRDEEIDDKFAGLTASEVIDALGGQKRFKTFKSEEELVDWIDDEAEALRKTMGLKKGDINRKRVMDLAVRLYNK